MTGVEFVTFAVCAVIVLIGAVGVVAARNPVHSALFLVQTLFGVAVLFVIKEAYFLAAVQVIVYAGAIVILFLFVIMLLGVDRAERLDVEPIMGIRPLAAVVGAALVAGLFTVIFSVQEATGRGGDEANIPIDPDRPDVNQLGDQLFTDWVFAFLLTGLLLTIAVVGAVVLARRQQGELAPLPDSAPMVQTAQAASAGADSTVEPDADGDDEA